jgi:glycerophosphoryl diester phosphodiesterase
MAISTAIALGADMVEVDVRLCKDNRLVVFHDDHLERTIRCPHLSRRQLHATSIADLTLEEIRTLDAGAWWGLAFAEEPVPTLEDVLRLCTGRTGVNIEIKTNGTGCAGDEERRRIVTNLTETLTVFTGVSPVVVSSFDHDVLRLLQKVGPMRLGVLATARKLEPALAVAEQVRAYSVHLPCSTVTARLVKRLHARGFRVYTYTANSLRVMRRLVQIGVDGIFTDYPDRLLSLAGRQHG